jgi:hypothetical protein
VLDVNKVWILLLGQQVIKLRIKNPAYVGEKILAAVRACALVCRPHADMATLAFLASVWLPGQPSLPELVD